MKIKLLSEDFPDGKIVDWPAVPGTGDWVSFTYLGGSTHEQVSRVEWDADRDGKLTDVTVTLS